MNLKRCFLMSKIFFLSTILFLCTAFTYREPNYCKIIDRITKTYLKEFAKPRRLMLTGYGGAMSDDIESVTLHFLSLDALNVDEARILYVEMMEELLQRINSHEKIRPYLHNFPFGVENIKLDIGFEDSKRRITQDGHVALMYIGRNQDLLYRACDPKTEEFYSLHREPYKEALRQVKRHMNCDSD